MTYVLKDTMQIKKSKFYGYFTHLNPLIWIFNTILMPKLNHSHLKCALDSSNYRHPVLNSASLQQYEFWLNLIFTFVGFFAACFLCRHMEMGTLSLWRRIGPNLWRWAWLRFTICHPRKFKSGECEPQPTTNQPKTTLTQYYVGASQSYSGCTWGQTT